MKCLRVSKARLPAVRACLHAQERRSAGAQERRSAGAQERRSAAEDATDE